MIDARMTSAPDVSSITGREHPKPTEIGMHEESSTVEECWLPVPGFEGYYSVSNMGRVRSEPRVVGMRNGRTKSIPQRILRPSVGWRGHFRVTLFCSALPHRRFIHRLVLQAFMGPCPDDMECCHHDGNPSNNRLGNLRWDTKAANGQDRIRHGTDPAGVRNPKAKLTASQVMEIRAMRTRGMVYREIAKHFPVNPSAVAFICQRRSWKHLP